VSKSTCSQGKGDCTALALHCSGTYHTGRRGQLREQEAEALQHRRLVPLHSNCDLVEEPDDLAPFGVNREVVRPLIDPDACPLRCDATRQTTDARYGNDRRKRQTERRRLWIAGFKQGAIAERASFGCVGAYRERDSRPHEHPKQHTNELCGPALRALVCARAAGGRHDRGDGRGRLRPLPRPQRRCDWVQV